MTGNHPSSLDAIIGARVKDIPRWGGQRGDGDAAGDVDPRQYQVQSQMLDGREGELSREIVMATLRKRFESEAFKKRLSKDGEHEHAFLAAGREQGPGRTGNGRTADR